MASKINGKSMENGRDGFKNRWKIDGKFKRWLQKSMENRWKFERWIEKSNENRWKNKRKSKNNGFKNQRKINGKFGKPGKLGRRAVIL